MRYNRPNLISVTVSLVLAAISSFAARAEVTYQLIDRGVPTDGVTTATGYHGYTLRFSTDSGVITALALDQWGGLSGPLVQSWSEYSSDTGLYTLATPGFNIQQNLAPHRLNFDSHILAPAGVIESALPVFGPIEDATIGLVGTQFGTFPVNSLTTGYGQGSFLAAAYGIAGPYEAATVDAAYIVMPDGGTISFSVSVATSTDRSALQVSNWRVWNPPGNAWNTDPANQNWITTGFPRAFVSNADVRFTDAGLAASGGVVSVQQAGVDVRNISFQHNSGTYSFEGGAIHGSATLRTAGAGVVRVGTPMTFDKGVRLFGGTMLLNSVLNTPTLLVSREVSGGNPTLGGNGTVHGLANIASALSPGEPGAVGIITVDRALLDACTLRFDVGRGSADSLVVTTPDALSFSGISTFQLTNIGGATPGTYTLIEYAGSALQNLNNIRLSSGMFAGFPALLVNNTANTSIDLQILPEPTLSSALMILAVTYFGYPPRAKSLRSIH